MQSYEAEENVRMLIFATHRSVLSTVGLNAQSHEQQNHIVKTNQQIFSSFSAAC
jgi:hypothetical protein